MRRLLIILVLLAIVGGAAYGGSIALFAFSAYRPGTSLSSTILVRKGQTPSQIGSALVSEGAIGDREQFVMLGRLTRQWRKIKAGEYRVSAGQSPMELFAVITSGVSVVHPVTIREGENMYEVASDLAAKKLINSADVFLDLCRDSSFISTLGLNIPDDKYRTLEGYLFPDTYHFNVTMTPEEMIRQMTRKFVSEWDSGLAARAKQLGYTRHQVVILASIIEKETGSPKERDLISSVFHNRLRKRMKLQSDPTTIYGMWDRYKGNIRKSDLLAPSPYNTYVIPALPAGPISNPGKQALQSALFPAKSEFLYFVSHNDGTSEFTATLEAHNRAVKKWQMDPTGRAGKSWRDLHGKN